MRKIYFIIWFLFSCTGLYAEGIQLDEENWKEKREKVLTEDFQKEDPAPENTAELPPKNNSKAIFKGLQILALVIVVGLVIWALALIIAKSGGHSANKKIRERRVAQHLEEVESDLEEVSISPLLTAAIKAENYTLAIRLAYLKMIQGLSDAEYIQWKKKYTNFDYVHQLKAPEMKAAFQQITFYFESVWYGDKEVKEELYQEVQGLFTQFSNQFLSHE